MKTAKFFVKSDFLTSALVTKVGDYGEERISTIEEVIRLAALRGSLNGG